MPATLTLKNIPDDVYARLKLSAETHRRSLNSGAILCPYLPSDRNADAEALLERDPEWVAPVLWRSEFRNILAGHLRRKMITFDQICSL